MVDPVSQTSRLYHSTSYVRRFLSYVRNLLNAFLVSLSDFFSSLVTVPLSAMTTSMTKYSLLFIAVWTFMRYLEKCYKNLYPEVRRFRLSTVKVILCVSNP
jgi:hypothetical protein